MERQNVKSDLVGGLIQLTRWKEHIVFVTPLTLLGGLMAVRMNDLSLDWQILTILAANIVAVTCGFMINDIEDAPDDARDPERALRNPISAGAISVRFGYTMYYALSIIAIMLYGMVGPRILVIASVMMIFSHLYSWRPVRLKAFPIVDILSHSVLLGGFLILSGYLVYSPIPGNAWWVIASATFGSLYGQFYNQIRDYELDKEAGLLNTTILIGKNTTQRIMYLSIALTVICLAIAIVVEVFPAGLIIACIIGLLLSIRYKSGGDMRGTQAVDASGAQQVRGLIVLNVIIMCWFAYVLVGQMWTAIS